MRILLIIPTFLYKYRYPAFISNSDFPVGFAYLASALRGAGHEVFGLNPNNDPGYRSAAEMLYEKIHRSLKESQPDLIGLGGLCTDFKFLKDAIQIIRNLAPDVPIVCGGGIINHDAGFIFKTLRPDFCIIGEGEEALVQLVKMLESDQQDYEQIANLGYWRDGAPQFTRQDFDYLELDKRCFPDYEPFGIADMLNNYSLASRYVFRYTRAEPRPMTLVTARGCPFSCTFCVHRKGPKYRSRSVENIIQEIGLLYERYHFNILLIIDELFAVNKQRLKEFCIALINARKTSGWDFDWLFQTHPSAALNREDLELAKKAGCYFFTYGLESASPKVLVSMNKRTRLSCVVEAIENANAQSVGFGGNFIFGDMAETTETISETMDFFSRYCLDNHIFLTFVHPYPGSALFDKCRERGIVRDKLDFYEHMDEGIFNMTVLPDALWIPLADKLECLGTSFSWVKSAPAKRYTKEISGSVIALYTDRSIWKVWAECPHCGREVYYREPLDNIHEKQADSLFLSFRRLFLRITAAYRREKKAGRVVFYNLWAFIFTVPRRLARKTASFFIIPRHPIFKSLERLMAGEERPPLSFITGCRHCHKRFRVNLALTQSKV